MKLVPCPACRALDFNLYEDERTGEADVRCANCRRPFVRREPVRPAPRGQAVGIAPAGGPRGYRP